ncbi:uncharacterized protein LOC144715880 [Wolffia australiana]
MRIGDDRVRKTSAQNLRRQFDLMTFKEGESVEDYALRLNSMASTLTTLGDKIEETQVVEKIIRSVPQRFRSDGVYHEGKLYLTEEEWNARQKKQDVGRGSSNSARRGRRGRGPARGNEKGSSGNSGRSNDECRKCGKLGHWAQIQLQEEKVFAHLGDKEPRDEEMWVLDTGATNHMSGSRMAFTELDAGVLGSVRFGDKSVAQIEG